jgi:uncharacterized protein YcfL
MVEPGGRQTTNSHRIVALMAGAIAASALLLVACGTNTYATSAPKSNIDIVQRVQRDPGLASDIVIEGARLDNKAGDKIGQVTVRNVGQSERLIQYRFDWFDKMGTRVSPSSTPWRTKTIDAGQADELTSPGGSDADDFRLSIRNNR